MVIGDLVNDIPHGCTSGEVSPSHYTVGWAAAFQFSAVLMFRASCTDVI